MVEQGEPLGRRIGSVSADEAPQHGLVMGVRCRDKVQQQAEGYRQLGRGRVAGVDMPDRIVEALRRLLLWILGQERQVLVDGARDDIEIEALGRLRLLEHVKRKALGRGIGQPFLYGQTIALRCSFLLL